MPHRSAMLAPLATALLLAACASTPDGAGGRAITLRDAAAPHGLRIGTAADRSFRVPGDSADAFRAVMAREFDMLTPENDLKFVRLRPTRDTYSWERADSLLAFAERHGMRVRGHTLVWHSQLSPWVTEGRWTREEATALMLEHIRTVAGRYRGRLAAWDVVNEAVADDASPRETFWSTHVGPDYIELAFRAAREADPGTPLFYNDYGNEGLGAKSDSVYHLVRRLVRGGVPIDGIGFQMHLRADRLPEQEVLERNFARYAALGLKVHITELDVRVQQPATAESLARQAEGYRRVVAACLETPACDAVVVWGFTDADSWVPRFFPGWGSALPMDEGLRPKPAYHALLEALAGPGQR